MDLNIVESLIKWLDHYWQDGFKGGPTAKITLDQCGQRFTVDSTNKMTLGQHYKGGFKIHPADKITLGQRWQGRFKRS